MSPSLARPMSLPGLHSHPSHETQYRSLEVGEVRILELLPGQKDDPLLCKLQHVQLESPGEFEAVSYCWGTEPFDRIIEVEGGSYRVTPNLEAALRVFRWPLSESSDDVSDGIRRLWIDALCIHQEDIEEKSSQIRLMGNIYRKSTRLLVWLGVESDNSDLAIVSLSLAQQKQQDGTEVFASWVDEQESLDSFSVTFEAISCFLGREWFSRTWIVQEYMMAGNHSTLFHCGLKQLGSEILQNRHPSFPSRDYTFNFKGNGYVQSGIIDYKRMIATAQFHWSALQLNEVIFNNVDYNANSPKTRINILYWLANNRRTISKDPRDKVFATLGIIEQLDQHSQQRAYTREHLIVDYASTVQDIYSSLVKAVVDATGELNILGCCSLRSPLVTRSWTPDWSVDGNKETDFFNMKYKPVLRKTDNFSASKNERCQAKFASDLSTLTVKGLCWDVVDKITIYHSNNTSEKEMCLEVWGNVRHRRSQFPEQKMKVAFWQTVLIEPTLMDKCIDPPYDYEADVSELVDEMVIPIGFPDRPDINKDSFWVDPNLYGPWDKVRDYVVTEKGCIGKVCNSGRVRAGDIVCILLGSSIPLVLRPIGGQYEVVCDIYLGGVMFGEGMDALEAGEVHLQDFELI